MTHREIYAHYLALMALQDARARLVQDNNPRTMISERDVQAEVSKIMSEG